MAADEQRNILLNLVQGEEGQDWADERTGWKYDQTSVCEWSGITCNIERNVTEIRLPAADLLATIPSELGLLSSLELIDLKKNLLRGTIPAEFASLPNLAFCNLAGNQLKGAIPAFGSAHLNTLDLSRNGFQGHVPPDFGARNVALTFVDLQYNFLSGYIPYGLEGLRFLSTISLSHNLLSGTLPNYVGSLAALEYLYLNHNTIVGTIPVVWGDNSSSLKELWLQDNLLSGHVPEKIALNPALRDLYLDGNKLTGEIPVSLCRKRLNLDFLEQINKTAVTDINCDSIACPSNYVSRDGLYPCHDCSLQGTLKNPYIGQSGECRSLTESLIISNFFTVQAGDSQRDSACLYNGVTCDTQGRVVKIIAPNRKLVGSIPDSFGFLQNLQELDVSDNELTGFLPSGLRFAPLNVLDVSGNQLRGIVPPLLCNMDKVNGNGQNGDFVCNNIACPIGTYSQTGRGICRICDEGGAAFLGSKTCGIVINGSSIASTDYNQPHGLHGIGFILFLAFLAVAIIGALLTAHIFVARYVKGREQPKEVEKEWTIDEDRTSFPHTEELKARLQRLRRRSSPGQWLSQHLQRAQSYIVSFPKAGDVDEDLPVANKIQTHEDEVYDYGWRERESILKHREIERAVATQKETSSLVVWYYPDPLERDALSMNSLEGDTKFDINENDSNVCDTHERGEMFLDVPNIE